MIHTLLVSDTEPIAVEGLRNLLATGSEFQIVAALDSLPETLMAVQQLSPSVILLDKAFGVHAIMDCLQELRERPTTATAVVWGVSLPEAESLRFIQAGARGAVRKTAPLEIILDCLRSVASGSTWTEPDGRRDYAWHSPSVRSTLTMRELQVMELVEMGFKNKDIGQALGICTGTVKIHLKHIFEKTGIRGRYGLALSGLKEKGLLATQAPEPV
jgi:DNA-binding NarL/FixJ family response regulator